MTHHTSPDTWQEVVALLIATIPSIIAAIAAIKAGKKVDRHDEWERNGRPGAKKNVDFLDGNTASNPDWYRPPELWSIN